MHFWTKNLLCPFVLKPVCFERFCGESHHWSWISKYPSWRGWTDHYNGKSFIQSRATSNFSWTINSQKIRARWRHFEIFGIKSISGLLQHRIESSQSIKIGGLRMARSWEGRVVKGKNQKPLHHWLLPIGRILWKEVCDIFSFLCSAHTIHLMPYVYNLDRAAFISLSSIISKALRNVFHLVQNDKGSIQVLGKQYRALDAPLWFECKPQPYFCPKWLSLQTYHHRIPHKPCFKLKEHLNPF